MAHGLNAGGNGIAGGVISGGHQKAKEIAEFKFRHHLTVGAGLQDHVQHAACIARSVFTGHQVLGIFKQFRPCRRVERHHPVFIGVHLVQNVVGEIGVGVCDQRVAFFHQPR